MRYKKAFQLYFINFIFTFIASITVSAKNYTNYDNNYGKTWMWFPDGNGVPQVVNLTPIIPNARINEKITSKEYINFELYTRQHYRQPKKLQLAPNQKRNTLDEFNYFFNSNLETKIIIHGWMSSTHSDIVQNIKDAYLKTADYNVIAVNWQPIASNTYYFASASQTRDVGLYTAELIDYLIIDRHVNPKMIQIIGHSLGAHAAGYAGSYTKMGRVGRITGLDPAMPAFEGTAGPESRLDETDGDFVDVIHSCGGTLGYMKPLGSIDFYPNGGKAIQPGCNGLTEIIEACSHGRAYHYYTESILEPNAFYGHYCDSWQMYSDGKCNLSKKPVVMGAYVPDTAKGVFFLKTNDKSPFGLGLI